MDMVTGFKPVRSFASVDLPNLRLWGVRQHA